MRETMKLIDKSCIGGLADRVPVRSRKDAAIRVKLAIQIVGSTILNTVVEAWHPHVGNENALS